MEKPANLRAAGRITPLTPGIHFVSAKSLWKIYADVESEDGVLPLVPAWPRVEDAEESGGLFVRVLLQPGVDLGDEHRCHGGERTGLSLGLAWVRRICPGTHEYQGCVQISITPLDEFLVVLFSRFALVLVEFCTKILCASFLWL